MFGKKKKEFKDRKVVKFLKEKGPKALQLVGDILPDRGALGVLKGLIERDDTMLPQDKEVALELLKMDMAELDAVTSRWKLDMEFGNVLSKSIRPLAFAWVLVMLTIMMVATWFGYTVPEEIQQMYLLVAVPVVSIYTGGKIIEKRNRNKYLKDHF